MEFEEDITINQLSPSNYYEAQVLSQLQSWKGLRLTHYRYPKDCPFNLSDMRNNFSNKIRHNYFKEISNKATHDESARFEADLYFQPCPDNQDIISTHNLLSASVSKIHKISGIDEGIMTNKWIFIELTQGPQFIVQKLWQLERALLLIPLNDKNISVGSVVILVNGEESEFATAMSHLQPLPVDSKLSRLPVYIGWVPTRNIFSTLSKLTDTMATFSTSFNKLEGDVDAMKGDVDAMKGAMVTKDDLKSAIAYSQRVNMFCFAFLVTVVIVTNRWR